MCSLAAGGECSLALTNHSPSRPAQLVAAGPTRPGQLLLSLAPPLLLSSRHAAAAELAPVLRRYPDLDVPPFLLALAILLEDSRGDRSPLHPLLRSLPTEAQLRGMPIMMTRAQLRRLRGTDAHALAADLSEEMHSSYEEYIRPIAREHGWPFRGVVPPLERWRWSLAVTWRCALPFGQDLVLAPLLSAASHASPSDSTMGDPRSLAATDPSARVTWNARERLLYANATRALVAGSKITIDFGRKSSAELLVARGELGRQPATSVRFYMSGVEADEAPDARGSHSQTAAVQAKRERLRDDRCETGLDGAMHL